jgi:hypothetical protein
LIADALYRLEKDESSDESSSENPTAQCMAAIISRSEIINDKRSTDGFEMAQSFFLKQKRKPKMKNMNFLCKFLIL